jgi:hypothetical protein
MRCDGDTLVVARLDRLGRSLRDLANVAHEIEEAGANPQVLEQKVDTSTAAGRVLRANWLPSRPTGAASASSRASPWLKARGVNAGQQTLDRGRISSWPRMAWGPPRSRASWA